MTPTKTTASVTGAGHVLVIGAGLMGSQIAVEYALGGWHVTCLVRDVAASGDRLADALAVACAAGLTGAAGGGHLAEGIRRVESLEELADEPTLVVESLPEQMEHKVSVLAPVVRLFPSVAIASNTASLSITELGTALGAANRVLGTHYWNPPLLMPPVELILTEATDPALAAGVRAGLERLGKLVVIVTREVPGFIWNRLQAALLREALNLVTSGVASAQDVDLVVREGLARRLRYCGPIETVALGGVANWQRVMANLLPTLSNADAAPALSPLLTLSPDDLDAARRRRDEGLARELRGPGAE